jgi:hypothetical protein
MKGLSHFVFATLLLIAASCASSEKWESENIPFPRSTPFDANEFARKAYLDGFRSGYRAEMAGEGTTADVLAPPYVQARRLGFYAGVSQARSERAKTP